MALRVFVALAPAAVAAVVVGACSSSDLNGHPLSDAGLPATGGSSSATGATGASTSSSSHASSSHASSSHASSSAGTGGLTTSTGTGTGGMTSTSSASTGGAAATSTGTGGMAATSTGTGGMAATSTGTGGADGGTDAGTDAGCTGTDTDCGGNCPLACIDGQHCVVNADCQSMSCMSGMCVAATCTDHIQNGMETDVDCGGPSCPKCIDGNTCGTGPNAGNNCVSKVCTGGICQTATCTDGVQNGTESDIDCGGSCPACHPGQKCSSGNDCVGQSCSGGVCACPQGMIVAPIQGAGIYCIDATEVSYGQYQIFYAANPPTAGQASYCSWNTNWTPNDNWPQPSQNSSYPVTNVNWCQAAQYCKYVGRRLCGKIGGGSIAQASFADFNQDQWYNACTAGGANTYPYGSTYKAHACNGVDSVDGGSPGPQSYFSLSSCLGGETNLLEMSGNVAEWEDSCATTTGTSDNCLIRGGSYLDGAQQLRCDSGGTPVTQTRNYQGPDVGFRCCL